MKHLALHGSQWLALVTQLSRSVGAPLSAAPNLHGRSPYRLFHMGREGPGLQLGQGLARAVLNGKKKSVPVPVFPKKPVGPPCAQPWLVVVGGWRLAAVGGWQLATGGWWRLMVVGGGWWLAIGGWWWLAVGGWQRLAVGSWQLAVGGG